MPAPQHPVAQLQGPFEESMVESVHDEAEAETDRYPDPVVRRNMLLEAPTYIRVVAGRWKQKPGEKFHPLWKIIAQISFGIHLLAEGMAKSEDEVMQILQAHVDEIDGFLERTTEDFDLAQDDIQERLRCLKLPLSHPATFEKMLEDRNFRLSIVEGNEKIEHIVERTSQAMKDSLKDVQKGFDSTSCLETYLQELAVNWHRTSVEHEAVFVAMLGNVEGWRKAFMSLHIQGNRLGGSLKKLTDIINEMQARAGEVSRRLLHQAAVQRGHQAMGRPTSRPTPTSRFQTLPTKQLPGMPERPHLRQTVSHETVRTSSSSRTQDSLRQQALRGRSQTPQDGMPSPQQLNTRSSPRIVQIGLGSQSRVQSMVPSLIDAAPSTRPNLHTPTPPSLKDEDEQPERHFPPVELPAHVPEETMRQAPMSKQNRLSVGLGLTQSNSAETHNSRLGTAALVDLLRSNPVSSKSSEKTKSLEASRRASTTRSNGPLEGSPSDRPFLPPKTPPQLSLISDTTSIHMKANIRRPKKGIQHWFDAVDDDMEEDEKYSLQGQESPQVDAIIVQKEQPPASEHGSHPGTPSWATTSFAQAEKRKELLKRGAFNSHPPTLPPGSPPLNQKPPLPTPLSVTESERRPSRTSSAGHDTLGEPGPEVTASETGSISLNLTPTQHKDQYPGRACAFAQAVIITEKAIPLHPLPKKQFIAEMEGCSPSLPDVPPPISARDMVVELEAPQQYFKLPPRPPPPKIEVPAVDTKLRKAVQTQETPPKEKAMNVGIVTPEPVQECVTDSADIPTIINQETITSTHEEAPNTKNDFEELEEGDRDDIVEQYADFREDGERLPSSVFIPTPSIPLPPSPYHNGAFHKHAEEQELKLVQDEQFFLLPALAYKAPPISPQLPPEPPYNQPSSETQDTYATTVEPFDDMQQGDTSQLAPAAQNAVPDQVLQPLSVNATQTLSPSKPEADEYDPFRPKDDEGSSRKIIAPKSSPAPRGHRPVGVSTLIREHKPSPLTHTHNQSSQGSQNGWKAFFTGQPSPVGSNLSIKSIRRESMIDHKSQQSPSLLSPVSASGRHPFPPSPVTSSGGMDAVWYSKSVDDVNPVSQKASNAGIQVQEGVGLGISSNVGGDASQQAVKAA